ncbi:MAG: hypothetical protein II040_02170, partial [Muribaculaceae bacterium]|nr:hypothetical protein [Muribaculaceae bacterium]
TMNNLPKLVMALFALSSVVDIAEKIHNWGRDKNEKEEEKKQDQPSISECRAEITWTKNIAERSLITSLASSVLILLW